MSLEQARKVADAVLYEGYVLYPYRASADKNKLRWQFGVLVPSVLAESGWPEPSRAQTECLLDLPADDTPVEVAVTAGFLQVQPRERAGPSFDEGIEREVTASVPVHRLIEAEYAAGFDFAGGSGALRLSATRCAGPADALRLRVVLENTSGFADAAAPREEVLRHSLVGAHLLIAASGGARFLSLLDPPQWARAAAAECRNEVTYPVLVGDGGADDVVLSSPIILYDHPQLAPESPADFFAGTEIDELLALRTMTLTDAEKIEARATDPRAAELVDRVDALPPEVLERLHGTVRFLRPVPPEVDPGPDPYPQEPAFDPPDPAPSRLRIGGVAVGAGSRVRLRPGRELPHRRTDAQDMFLDGRPARVQAVLTDVDGAHCLAVTLEDDPGADLHAGYGRFRYFSPDEVEPLDGAH